MVPNTGTLPPFGVSPKGKGDPDGAGAPKIDDAGLDAGSTSMCVCCARSAATPLPMSHVRRAVGEAGELACKIMIVELVSS